MNFFISIFTFLSGLISIFNTGLYVEPRYIEMPIINTPLHELEPNDSYEKCMCILPDNYNIYNSYNNLIDGGLTCYNYCYDVDFYCLPLINNSMVNLNILGDNIVDGYFNVEIYCYEYSNIISNRATRSLKQIHSNYGGKANFYYDNILNAGTYIIRVSSNIDNLKSTEIKYKISLKVKIYSHQENINISDIKLNKNAIGALWVSDFAYNNFKELIKYKDNILYYENNTNDLRLPEYTIDELHKVNEYGPMKMTELYIWDKNIALSLQKIVIAFNREYIQTLKNQEKIRESFDLIYNIANNTVQVVTLGLSVIPVTQPISLFISCGQMVSFSTIKYIFNCIYPPLDVSALVFNNYTSRLIGNLDAFNNCENVVRVPISFNKLKDDSHFKTKYSIQNTIDTSFLKSNDETFLYYEPKIFIGDHTKNAYCGKIFVLDDFNKIFNFNDLSLAKNHQHDFVNHKCFICGITTNNHTFKKYEWIDYNKHKAFCDCGYTEVSYHVIKTYDVSTNKGIYWCDLCKGEALHGIIPYKNQSKANINDIYKEIRRNSIR